MNRVLPGLRMLALPKPADFSLEPLNANSDIFTDTRCIGLPFLAASDVAGTINAIAAIATNSTNNRRFI